MCSDTYNRIKRTWFGTWAWNNSIYGLRDKCIIQHDNLVEEVEVEAGTSTKHGRSVRMFKDGFIQDRFFKHGKPNGPYLAVHPSGNKFKITFWKFGKEVSR